MVREINPLVPNATADTGHVLDGIHSQVLVICEDEEKVGPGLRAGLGKGRQPRKSNETAELHDDSSEEAALEFCCRELSGIAALCTARAKRPIPNILTGAG